MADIKNHSTLATSLTQYFDLEEASGTRYNLVGTTHLSDGNTVGQATGKIGNCATFDGVNEYLEYASSTDFALSGAAARSASFWFKANDTTGTQIIASAWGSSGAFQNWIIYMVGSSLRFGAEQNSNLFSTTVSAGTWYHVVFLAKADGSYQAYVNNSSAGTGTPAGSAGSAVVMRLGAQSTGANAFQGEIEEFGWWEKQLSTSEISDLYNSGSALPYYEPDDIANDTGLFTNLVSHFSFDGDLTDDAASNDLTHSGTPTYGTGILGGASGALDLTRASSEYATISDASQSGFDFSGDMSVSAWFNADSQPGDMWIVCKGDVASGSRDCAYWLGTAGTGGALQARFSDDGTLNAAHNISTQSNSSVWTTSAWYHVVWVFDISTDSCKIYVNGVNQTSSNSGTMGATLNNSTDRFDVGSRENGGSPSATFDGRVDHITLWSRALNEGEIRAMYGYGAPPVYSAAVGGARRVFIIS